MKLVIFDLDGTLVHFPHDYLISEAIRINVELGHPVVDAGTVHAGFEAFDFFRFVESTFDRAHYTERFWELFNWAHFPKPRPLPNTLRVLEAIRDQGIAMGIATARLTPITELSVELESTTISQYMAHIETRDRPETDWKDKTGQIARVCKALGVRPQDAVIVGDIPPDIESGKALGIGMTVAVASGGIRRDILEAASPDYLFDDISGLLELVPRWR